MNQLIHHIGKQLAALLHRVQPRRPEEQRRILIDLQSGSRLECDLVDLLGLHMGVGIEFDLEIGIHFRLAILVRRIQNTGRTAGIVFARHLPADVLRHEGVTTVDHLLEERRTHRVDEVRGKNSAGKLVDRIGRTALLIIDRLALVI